MRGKNVFLWSFVLLVVLGLSAREASAGACLCVTRNMENDVVSFACTELSGTDAGAAGCSNYCKGKGFNGYDWLTDETCNSLYKKIKSQKIKLSIKDIQIGPVRIGTDQQKSAQAKGAVRSAATLADAQPTLEGSGSIEAAYDTFYIPDQYGGGRTTTTNFTGTIKFQLTPDPANPNRYIITLTSASTTVDSLDLNGFQTGVLHGTLNTSAPNSGELDTSTGAVSFLFSQVLTPDLFPDQAFHTWSFYHGTCNNCLNGGTVTLDADSFYISPVE